MLSSSKPDKNEGKFAGRIDVLTERVDTLASTLATTASAMAKKDGELAALRRELDTRDQRIADLITQARNEPGSADLRELRNSVAALAKERSKGGSSPTSKQLDDLTAKVMLLTERVETVSSTVSTTAAGLAGREGEIAALRKRMDAGATASTVVSSASDPGMTQRVSELATDVHQTRTQVDGLSSALGSLRTLVEQRPAETQRPSDEIREMLVALRTKVEELAGLRAGVTEDQLEQRVAKTDEGIAGVSTRVDAITAAVDSAVSSLADKEHELAALNRHFTESGARIESIVEDIRDALAALPEPGATSVDDLAARLERVVERIEAFEKASRESAETHEHLTSGLVRRIDDIEAQVATVASEVSRAKTLWPVALRSLEARLDDVASHARLSEPSVEEPEQPAAEASSESADEDLLAGLRDSLQAMETVAAEMAKASDTLSGPDTDVAQKAVAAGGATVVRLRTTDP